MARVHDLAEEAIAIVRANGFEPVTWENFPIKIMMVITELDEAADAVFGSQPDPLGEELADAAIRLLGILHELGPGWPSRVEGRVPKGDKFRSIESHLWPIVGKCSKAVEFWRKGKHGDAFIASELALLEVYRAADRLGVDLDAEIVRKNAKNAARGHLHGKAKAVG